MSLDTFSQKNIELYKSAQRRYQYISFAVVMVVAFVVMIAGGRVLYHFDVEMKANRFFQIENTFLQVQKSFIAHGLLSVVNDLGVMVGHQHSAVEKELTLDDYKDEFLKEMTLLCYNRSNYLKISIINLQGKETLKVVCDDGQPVISSADEMNDLSGTQLFNNSTHMNSGEVYVSDLEEKGLFLHKKTGISPTVQVITPFSLTQTHSDDGDEHDELLTELDGLDVSEDHSFGQELINEDITHSKVNSYGISSYMLISYMGVHLDSHGVLNQSHFGETPQGGELFLISSDNRMFKNAVFNQQPTPNLSELLGFDISVMSGTQQGKIDTEEETYYYLNFNPATEALKMAPGERKNLISTFTHLQDFQWTLLSRVNNDQLPFGHKSFVAKLAIIFSVFLMILWSLYYYISRYQMQRALTQFRLDQQRIYLNNVLNSMVDCVISTDSTGTIIQTNKSALALISVAGGNFVDSDHNILEYLQLDFPKDNKQLHAWIKNKLTSTTGFLEGFICTSSEQQIPIEVAITESGSGTDLLFIWVIRVTTERKEAEADLQNLHKKYIHREKLAEAGLLVSGILHEVSNPLASIQGMLSNLLYIDDQRDKAQFNDHTRETIESVFSHVDRVKNISLEVSSFLRPTTSIRELGDLNGLINSTVNLLRFDGRWSKINLELELDLNIPALFMVPDQIIQVVMNLMTNAGDAAIQNNIENPVVKVTTQVIGLNVWLSVTDNGIGIDSESKKRIFQPFYTTKAERGGTGLGLPLCTGIIQDHSGEMVIDSELGKGTVVKFSLPINVSE